jgi:hypothetical protein
MAIVVGNKTAQLTGFTELGNTRKTISHTQDSGTDRMLMVAISMPTSVSVPNFAGATFNGVSMTSQLNANDASLGQRFIIYTLANPDAGMHDVVVDINPAGSGAQCSFFIASLTGVSGVGNTGSNNNATSPHSRSLTVSEGSMIFAFGSAYNGIDDISIAGSSRTLEYNHLANRYVRGAFSTSLSVGSRNVTITTPFNPVTNQRIEFQEASPPPSGKAEGSWLFLMQS